MSIHSFQFKQFKIHQDRCPMKITTDACLLGACAPLPHGTLRVLDIGAGTGLLSLMLAQRNPYIRIDAIEYDAHSASQARENIADSPWSQNINVIEADARTYFFTQKYDLIICNPPFFTASLLGPDDRRNNARHTISLTYPDLATIIDENLAASGEAAVLLPFTAYPKWIELMQQKNLYEIHRLQITPKPASPFNRVISTWSKAIQEQLQENILIIKDIDETYTTDFRQLLSPFYLYL